MSKRTGLVLGLVICICTSWALSNALADQSSAAPATRKVSSPRSKAFPLPNKMEISPEQQRINERGIIPGDRPNHTRPRDASDILPTWPAVAPLGPRERAAADPRNVGAAHCDFPACENLIYENTGGNSIGSFGDPDNIPLCDDVSFAASSTDRYVCRVVLVVGGISNTAETTTLTFSIRSGNFLPICPDDPASEVLHCETRNFQTTNPSQFLTIDFNPPILIDTNFVWICLQSTHADAAWFIATGAEQGFTDDDIVIPNTVRVWPDCSNCVSGNPTNDPDCEGTGFCEDLGPGQTDDYFYYGGAPTIAGMYVEIYATPGPPGACCNRDVMPATCADGVTRGDCLAASPTRAWKPGDCLDFDNTNPLCVTCITDADCISTSTSTSAEPNCTGGYQDTFNQGCDTTPYTFETIACNTSICATAGTFQAHCATDADCAAGIFCVGQVCQGSESARDNDWYKLVLGSDQDVTIAVEPRFDVEVALMNNGGLTGNCTQEALDFATGKACDVTTISRCLPPGEWWIRVRPANFSGVSCSTKYRIEVTCGACTLDLGACCDASVAGCTTLAQLACEGRGGDWLGDAPDFCAACGPCSASICPGVPANNECSTNVIALSGASVMVTFDTSFASTSDLTQHAGFPDSPADCQFGQPNAGVGIRQDIFYTYTIPTSFSGNPITGGKLVISTIGSVFDTWVVVYGNAGPTQDCTAAGLCTQLQRACNDDRINDNTAFQYNSLSHIQMDVATGSATTMDPGNCIKIRVGRGRGGVVPTSPLGAPGVLSIDFIPTEGSGYSLSTGRCCFYDELTQVVTCSIALNLVDCNNLGGKYRPFTDFNQGDPASTEDYAGCLGDPCPALGDACYTAEVLDFNSPGGDGGFGTTTRMIRNIYWFKYVVPSGTNGIVLDSCGSAGFYDPMIGVYTYPLAGTPTGDCNITSPLMLNDDCQVTQSSAMGALQVSTCFGGINATSSSCMCLPVNSAPGAIATAGDVLYFALGNSNVAGGQFEFGGSPRDIIIPVTDPNDAPVTFVLRVTDGVGGECFSCVSDCGGNTPEGETVCEDSSNPGTVDAIGPQDAYNGGCFSSPPSFEGPAIPLMTTPYRICGKAGNFTNPYPCETAADCPQADPCDTTLTPAACTGPTYINRDTDWYVMEVTSPTTIHWRVDSMEFAAEIAIFGDPLGDCNLFQMAADDVTFPCEPPTGVPNALEVSASVCAGTYYLYIAPSVFGGVGDVECDSEYVVSAWVESFVQLADCCPGDLNNDGKVNGLDIPKWIDMLFFPPSLFDEFQGCFAANLCRADVALPTDGLIDLGNDLPAFVNLLVQSNKPTCPSAGELDCFDPAFGQPTGPLENGQIGAVLSDLDTNRDGRAAECFCPKETGVITNICWWGTYLDFAGLECGPELDCFKVTFRRDDHGSARCPGSVVDPPGYQALDSAVQVERFAVGLLNPTGTAEAGLVTEYLYTATLTVPIAVTKDQCMWLEIVNDTPTSQCQWHWATSPRGNTLHAEVTVDPGTGVLPTDYSTCTEGPMDLAYSLHQNIGGQVTGLRVDKEGCGTPQGRCCYDVPPFGAPANLDCVVTSKERCEVIYFGEWTANGTCSPANPSCTVGRCCYLDQSLVTQCVITMQSTCLNLDKVNPLNPTAPIVSPRPGLWTIGVTDCGTSPCPVGHCCLHNPDSCQDYSEVRCLHESGTDWLAGTTCSGFSCPAPVCDETGDAGNAGRCQLPHVLANIQQGSYVSDADNSTAVADDFRPNANGTISQVCWRGFHSTSACGGGVGGVETFRIRFFRTTNNLPDTTQQVGPDYNVTPSKSIPSPAEGSPAPFNSQQFKYQASLSPTITFSASQCYWIEIQNTTVNSSCIWMWATSDEGGNNHAAMQNAVFIPTTLTGPPSIVVTTAANYQHLDRDLSFCMRPLSFANGGCTFSPPVPSNNACASAITLALATPTVGTTMGSTRDGTASCGSNNSSGGDVWYRVTTGATDINLTISTCGLQTTFDSSVSVHRTFPAVANECPGLTGTQINPLGQSCDDDGCTNALGTQQLFFPGRQGRRQVGLAVVDPLTTYLIRVAGKGGAGAAAHPGGSKGVFLLTATQP